MSFQAEVLNVFIASPYDVSAQRDEIEAIIYRWNKEHSKDLQTILLPRRWESDVAPGYDTVDAQQVINQNLLNDCDLLIGVFWTRLGAETTSFPSGTLEEISIFHEKGKSVMVYFVDKDLPTTTDFIEFQKVQDFKDTFRQKNLAFKYDSNRIASDLLIKIREHARKRGAFALENNVQTKIEMQENVPTLTKIIESDELITAEYVLLYYILQTGNRFLGARWMSNDTLKEISEWEGQEFLKPILSSQYDLVIANMAERGLIEESEYTSHGNPRLYTMPIQVFNELRSLRGESIAKVKGFIETIYELPF